MAMTGTKAFALLAAVTAGAVFGTASSTWAQHHGGGGTNTHGSVQQCSLAGVNPAHHPEIFGNPAVAATYGFIQSDGSWHVAPGCQRGAATFAPAAAAFAAAGQPVKGIGEPVHNSDGGLLMSDGLCWVQNNATAYRWGLCPSSP
jgi:hypothetical protein